MSRLYTDSGPYASQVICAALRAYPGADYSDAGKDIGEGVYGLAGVTIS